MILITGRPKKKSHARRRGVFLYFWCEENLRQFQVFPYVLVYFTEIIRYRSCNHIYERFYIDVFFCDLMTIMVASYSHCSCAKSLLMTKKYLPISFNETIELSGKEQK